jgi:hypothetical protein
MIGMFVFISLVLLPVLMAYSSHDAFKDDALFMITKYSLGNMGAASQVCASAP